MKRFTVAMVVVTAALFAGAIYENCKPDPSAEELSCEAMKPQIEAFEAMRAAKHTQLAGLFGAKAQPGARFAGIAIGQRADPAAIDAAQNTTLPTAEQPYSIWIRDTNGTVTNIEVELGRYDIPTCQPEQGEGPCACVFAKDDRALCDDFKQQLVRAWGPPTDGGWTDDSGHRATYSECTLAFE